MTEQDLADFKRLRDAMDPVMADALIGNVDFSPLSMEMNSEGYSFERELETTASKTALIQDVTGLPEDEIKKILNSGRHLSDFVPCNEREMLSKGWTGRAFKKLENEFLTAGGNVSTAMTETFELFQEKFTAQEQSLIQKSIAALDVGLFLKFMAAGMQRA